jgi:hypothetical protein
MKSMIELRQVPLYILPIWLLLWTTFAHSQSKVAVSDINKVLDSAPISVEIVDFTAKQYGDQSNILTWTNLSKDNNLVFYIEKSSDGIEFYKIGFVEGTGSTNELQTYAFIDYSFFENAYYRLRQVDYDGQYEIHDVISMVHGSTQNIEIYPNPILSDRVSLSGPSDIDFKVHLTDLSGVTLIRSYGNVVHIEELINHLLPKLKPSVYLLKMESNHGVITNRLVKN